MGGVGCVCCSDADSAAQVVSSNVDRDSADVNLNAREAGPLLASSDSTRGAAEPPVDRSDDRPSLTIRMDDETRGVTMLEPPQKAASSVLVSGTPKSGKRKSVQLASIEEFLADVRRFVDDEFDILAAEALLVSLEAKMGGGAQWNEIVSSPIFQKFAEKLNLFYEVGKACCGQADDWFAVYKEGTSSIHASFDLEDASVLHYRVRVQIPAKITNVMAVANESQLMPEWNTLVTKEPEVVGRRTALHFRICYQMSVAAGMFKVDILNEVRRFLDPEGGFLAEFVSSVPQDDEHHKEPVSGHKRADTELKNIWIPCGSENTVLIQVGKLRLPFKLSEWVVRTLGSIAGRFVLGGLVKNSLRSTKPGNPWEGPLKEDSTGFYRRLESCLHTDACKNRSASADTVGPFDMAVFFHNHRIRQMVPGNPNFGLSLRRTRNLEDVVLPTMDDDDDDEDAEEESETLKGKSAIGEEQAIPEATKEQSVPVTKKKKVDVQEALVEIADLVDEVGDVLAAGARLTALETELGSDSEEWAEASRSPVFQRFQQLLNLYIQVGQSCCAQNDDWFSVYKDDGGASTIHGCFDKDDAYVLHYRVRVQIPAKITNVMAVANESQLLQEWNTLVVKPPEVVGRRKALHFVLNYQMSVLHGMYKVDLLNEIRRYVDVRGGFLAEYIRSVPKGHEAYREPLSGYKRPETELRNIWVACGSGNTVLIQAGTLRLPFSLSQWVVTSLGGIAGKFIIGGLVKNSLRSTEPGNPWEQPLREDATGFYGRLEQCMQAPASTGRVEAAKTVGPPELAPYFHKHGPMLV